MDVPFPFMWDSHIAMSSPADWEFPLTLLFAPYIELPRWQVDCVGDPFWRLYWNDRAGAFAADEQGEHPLEPTHFVVIPPETPFLGRLERPVCHLYPTFVTGAVYQRRCIHRFPVCPEARRQLAILTGPSADSTQLERRLAAHALVFHALCRIPADGWQQRRFDPRIQAVLDRMQRELQQPGRNADWAATAHLSTNAFIRLFTENVGRSPLAWFQKLKIDQACIWLTTTSWSIEEIAERLGFCDRYHFSKQFKKLRHISPARYRAESLRPAVTPASVASES